ncbi:hypothetical protein GCM10028805_13090 [Spirosoma harenae]
MSRKLNWVKEAFSREVAIMQDGNVVGGMHQNGLRYDVDAHLNKTQLRFDVTGFLIHSVDVYDLAAENKLIGKIEFSFGKRAELKLESGESYLWKRHNVLMREWEMIHETPDGMPEKEVISYDQTRKFFGDHGDIVVEETDVTSSVDIIILTGLFIRNYFQRRRRIAAVAAVGVAAR